LSIIIVAWAKVATKVGLSVGNKNKKKKLQFRFFVNAQNLLSG